MIEIVVYMLISVSDGMYNKGTVTNIAYFKTLESCKEVGEEISGYNTDVKCIKSMILVKE